MEGFGTASPPAPRGYRSERARQQFAVATGLVGLAFFLIQVAMPFFLFGAISRRFRGYEGRIESQHVWDSVYWQGSLWYIEESLPPRMLPNREAVLQRLDPDGKRGPETVTSMFMEDPRLLPGIDRLWVISPEDVRYYRGGRKTAVGVPWRLGDISYPFLIGSDPAVLEERPGGIALTVLRHGRWERGPLMRLEPRESEQLRVSGMRVVPCADRFHVFAQFGATVEHHESSMDGITDDWRQWEPVASRGNGWSVTCVAGLPTLFVNQLATYHDSVLSYQRVEGKWKRAREYSTLTQDAVLGVSSAECGSRLFLLASWPRIGFRVNEMLGDVTVEKTSFMPSSFQVTMGQVLRTVILAGACYLVAPIVLALLLSGMMSLWRDGTYKQDEVEKELAPMWRRAAAEIVDSLVLGGPLLFVYLRLLWPMLSRTSTGPMYSSIGLAAMWLVALIWVLAGFLVFSWLEGKWGVTPGKWMAGIRVVGTDLAPCGFLRGLIRNLLKVVDGFFNFMVGMLVTALSENWQRVGDMAARTIVVTTKTKAGAVQSPGPGAADPSQPSLLVDSPTV